MVTVDNLFFELLQVALGEKAVLSRTPSAEEWLEMYAESERQAVTGILLHGIERLKKLNVLETSGTSERVRADLGLNQLLLLEWIGVGQMIEQRNLVMDERCSDLLKRLSDYGLQGTILKGQGVARLYNVDLDVDLDKKGALGRLRQSGDIDVYVDCGLRKALEFAESLGQKNVDWDYKHLHLKLWDDTEVEMHYHVEVLLNLWKNRKLQKWFKTHTEHLFGYTDFTDTTEQETNTNQANGTKGFVTPTVEFNVFYILLHIYRHFLYEGVGFRQVIDYYFVLKNLNANLRSATIGDACQSKNLNIHGSYAYKAVREFGMEKFAKGLMWMMHEALGMPREWMLWEPDEKEGRYILKQVMTGGNFGHHDERLKHSGGKLGAVKAILTHNMHLLTHYPSDVIWSPVWIVWHKCWKLWMRRYLK